MDELNEDEDETLLLLFLLPWNDEEDDFDKVELRRGLGTYNDFVDVVGDFLSCTNVSSDFLFVGHSISGGSIPFFLVLPPPPRL